MLALSAASMSLLAERGIHLTFDVYDPTPDLNNVQIIDGADNATFSIFQASNEEFALLFPNGQDMEFAEDVVDRIGEIPANKIFDAMWERPILKRDADGIHGTIYFNYASKRQAVPASKREVDFDDRSINEAQRRLFCGVAIEAMVPFGDLATYQRSRVERPVQSDSATAKNVANRALMAHSGHCCFMRNRGSEGRTVSACGARCASLPSRSRGGLA
jgi:hypothetical protein